MIHKLNSLNTWGPSRCLFSLSFCPSLRGDRFCLRSVIPSVINFALSLTLAPAWLEFFPACCQEPSSLGTELDSPLQGAGICLSCVASTRWWALGCSHPSASVNHAMIRACVYKHLCESLLSIFQVYTFKGYFLNSFSKTNTLQNTVWLRKMKTSRPLPSRRRQENAPGLRGLSGADGRGEAAAAEAGAGERAGLI